ncbi:MAG: hypothetical protein ACRCWG_13955 [Sarcina sp.]
MHISVLINGSNDLYYTLKKSVSTLICNLINIETVSISIIYSFVNKNKDLWTYVESRDLKSSLGYIEYFDGILKEMEYKFECESSSLDIKKAIESSYKHNKKNILIVSGHGGPFQCMLDMSGAIDKSFNTYEFCSIINKYDYELVILDMCSMNFIEVIYELLHNLRVKRIITYKGFGIFEGIDYLKIIKVISKYSLDERILEYLDYPFIYLDNQAIKNFEKLKKINNKLVKKCLLCEKPNFSDEINDINKLINESVAQSDEAKNIKLSKLNYIKYFLQNEVERNTYLKYSFLENNLWSKFLFMDSEQGVYKEHIDLSISSLKNIIILHNPMIDKERLDKLVETYYENKKQE